MLKDSCSTYETTAGMDSIKVYVDGEELLRDDDWTYSKNYNTVYLDEMPDYGSYVVATYHA